jgi:hypothetical protein
MAALEARDATLVGTILREHLRHKAEMVHEAIGESATDIGVASKVLEAATPA